MDETKDLKTAEEQPDSEREYITEEETKSVFRLFKKCLRSYKAKDATLTDEQWLAQWFRAELPEITPEQAQKDAAEIVESIDTYNDNLRSVNEAARNGVSKERWLADKLQEASVGVSVNEFGQRLAGIDNALTRANADLANRLSVSVDGNISRVNMNPNLDGIIAEEMVAGTAKLSADLQGKNVRATVLQSTNANSVDVRLRDMTTGEYRNYQLKFGKDAKATIDLIERGNYNNQRIVVPTEQLEKVKAHFEAKGSQKTITDRIDGYGVESKPFTKEEMKNLQQAAQEDGIMPSMDYSHYQTKELAMSIGKNAGVMALQSAAITTGLTVAAKVAKGEKIDSDELVEIAIKTGADTTLKTVTAGTLQVAIRKGIISFIPKATPAGTIAQIACVGIENVKTLTKIASGELSVTKGLDQIGRTTVSMGAGLMAAADLADFAGTIGWVFGGPIGGVAAGLVGGMVGYFAGSKVGDAVYSAGKKVAETAKKVGKAAWNGLKSAGRTVARGVAKVGKAIGGLFRR